jgi:protein-disulfide isomerase
LIDLATKVSGAAPSEAFQTCVTGKAHTDWVSAINAAAEKDGVSQTPTMLINGKSVDIANLTPDALRAMITDASQR